MNTIPYSPTQVTELRNQAKHCGLKLSPDQAWKIMRLTNDLDLAVTAVLMNPRPKWLTEIIGVSV